MRKGTAAIDVSTDVLHAVLFLIPSTYKVIGSSCSFAPDTVRLIVESDDIAGHDLLMTCTVEDAGSTRKVIMSAVGKTRRP
ncbi:hypothetical protein F9K91_10545 [Brucella tritici]|uniref:Uncharacterized protein n=1 Tax=Brucella tritici TaxID=94626 RepID=A0A7X6JC95_9HYPH|nr:hypothetical protein [Brucella tritici]KAB2665168.1 hypothetical protein F9K91_10545 [Brucella tritici]NKW09826.1 hypothetical protein [Brucella tritici]